MSEYADQRGHDVTWMTAAEREELTLDERARRLGWDSNAEMTHQAHTAPAFGCVYCHPEPADECDGTPEPGDIDPDNPYDQWAQTPGGWDGYTDEDQA